MTTTTLAARIAGLAAVVTVRVERWEGGDTKRFFEGPRALEEAEKELHRWSHTAPSGGGYDKCGFTVTFANGDVHSGRFDLERGYPELAQHIRGHLRYVAQKGTPGSRGDVEACNAAKRDARRRLATLRVVGACESEAVVYGDLYPWLDGLPEVPEAGAAAPAVVGGAR